MARKSKDQRPDDSTADADGPEARGADVATLQQALDAETAKSATLRESLEALRQQVADMEATFSRRLDEATRRSAAAEHKLADQQQRLAALGNGRGETMRQLAETRDELRRVTAERDDLRRQFARVDGVQSATIALSEEDIEEPSIHQSLASIEELMASLSTIEEGGSAHGGGHLHTRVSLDEEESQIMIAPELVFTEEDSGDDSKPPNAEEKEESGRPVPGPTSRVLVFLDADQPIKYPLYKEVMTIGRSDQADIHVTGDFISRVHARLVSTKEGVTVEDLESKNGIKVNSKLTERQMLKHGDVIGLGKLRFTFIDTASGHD
jgi:hypothetical protein